MKQRIIMAIVALHSLVAAFAGNIVAGVLTMKPGETKALEISLPGSVSNVYGIQFDIRLPEGFTFVKDKEDKVFEMAGNQVEDITCKDLELGDGVYRFLVYSASLQKLRSGLLMSVKLKVSDTMPLDNYTVTIDNVASSDADGHVTKEDGITVGIKVTDFFTLLYKVDGEEYKSFELEYGESISPETEPIKEGCSFSGWSEIPKTMPAHDVMVTGTFTANKYKLTYFVNGKEYKTFEVEYGASINKEAFPEQEGYTFSGWSDVPETMPAHDVTVTGSFTINKYKLVYKLDGKEYKSFEVEYGSAIIPETELAKDGYTFSGWSEIPETMPAKDVTVTGTFTVNTYKLTYIVDGEDYKSLDIEYGSSISAEVEPSKEGYTFSGWSEIPETMPAKDVTVSGTFTKGAFVLTYMVDGKIYKTIGYDYDASITPEAEPTKEGYSFSGWSEIPEKMPANDVTVTGSFTVNTYTLTYQVDGKVYKTYDVAYGTAITPEAEPEKEGYTFSGWNEMPETMPANDVVLKGTFAINTYQVTYMIGGEVFKTDSIQYGATIVVPEATEREDYTFDGWADVPETMPAHDIVIYGSYTSGIIDVSINEKDVRIYDVKGHRIPKLQRGVNIIRTRDGRMRKVMVK